MERISASSIIIPCQIEEINHRRNAIADWLEQERELDHEAGKHHFCKVASIINQLAQTTFY